MLSATLADETKRPKEPGTEKQRRRRPRCSTRIERGRKIGRWSKHAQRRRDCERLCLAVMAYSQGRSDRCVSSRRHRCQGISANSRSDTSFLHTFISNRYFLYRGAEVCSNDENMLKANSFKKRIPSKRWNRDWFKFMRIRRTRYLDERGHDFNSFANFYFLRPVPFYPDKLTSFRRIHGWWRLTGTLAKEDLRADEAERAGHSGPVEAIMKLKLVGSGGKCVCVSTEQRKTAKVLERGNTVCCWLFVLSSRSRPKPWEWSWKRLSRVTRK